MREKTRLKCHRANRGGGARIVHRGGLIGFADRTRRLRNSRFRSRPGEMRKPGLTLPATSDIMSDMRVFTVRELDRQPAVVLDTCDREGAVRVKRRDGRSYIVRPDAAAARKVPWRRLVAEHRARIARIFPEPLPEAQVRLVDLLVAGE